ncbi:MAG: FG-GAP-like repeat-containing protein, partial [Candidatus Eisenbacteria bacterium]|nr:FG-GAP-like repeat-containing protein [Candidatus Eisenbacteria bacterium]
LVAGLLAAPAGATAPDPAPDRSASGEITHAWFGSAVSTTGDVNGDGLSDLIVGAGNYGSQRGRIRIYYGAAAGMDSLADWTRNGAQGNQGLGVSVSTAGDVNGDGYDDFLAGSPYFTGTNAEEGKLHLYFGSPGGPVEAAEYTQGQLYAHLGMSVAGGGDFDGDGYDDFAVGAPLLENSQLDEGGVLVFYGRANQAPATYEQWLQPNIASASFGASVSVAGDVNGDGYDDLIVGAPKYAGAGTERGAAFVYLGGPNGLGPNPLWTKVAAQDGSHLGSSVAGAGDVNGDGYADVVVGGPDAGNLQQGQAWLYRGGAAGPEADPFWIGTVSQASAHFGAAVATAGDFDGDGYADVVVGAPGYNGAGGADEGLARLYRGSIGGLVLVREHTCGQPVAGFGVAVATGGDVDGDGFSDLLIGAGRWDGSQQDEGRVFLYRGHARTLAGNPEWSWNGQPASYVYDRQPPSSCSGDWNGDGRSDIAIGDPHAPELVGRVDVFYGSSAGPSGAPGWSFVGDSYHVHLGRSVAAGDLDGDGYDELLVSAPGSLYENAGPGRVFVFRGGPSGLSGSPDLVLEGEQDGSLFGHGLAWAGDVDGDGYGDVVVGAPRHGSVDAPSGRLLLYREDPDALLHPAPLVADGAPGERLGHTI